MADYATLLRDHTTLTCRSVDRIFPSGLRPWAAVPRPGGPIPAAAPLPVPILGGPRRDREKYVAEIKRWATAEGVPIRYFKKGEKKEAIAEPLLEAAAKEGGEGRVGQLAGTPQCWRERQPASLRRPSRRRQASSRCGYLRPGDPAVQHS